MITVEDLLMAYASAYDAWLDPEVERKNPTPEYAEIIRQAVSFENAKLRELVRDWRDLAVGGADSLADWNHKQADLEQRMHELGVDT